MSDLIPNKNSEIQIVPANEAERLSTLKSYEILDTESETSFDEITKLASQICDCPVSLIGLIDEKRNWFKSKTGTDYTSSPREYAFCAHTILDPNNYFVVENALIDERFKNNPLVTTDPNIRFYAGAPLVTKTGIALGTLCVIDVKPKTLTEFQLNALKTLSHQVMSQIELRKKITDLEKYQNELAKANSFQKSLLNSETHFLIRTDVKGNYIYANKKYLETFNFNENDIIGLNSMNHVYKEDENIVIDCISKCFAYPSKIFNCVFRKQLNGELVWTEWEFTAITNNKNEIIKIQGVGLNINQLKKETEDLLLKNRALEKADEGIIISDLRKEFSPVIYVNNGFTKITGYDSNEILGKNCSFLQGEESDETIVKAIRDAIKNRKNFSGEILNYRKDGSKFWNFLNLTPVPDDSGNITHYIGVQTDITARKNQEINLKKTLDLTHEQNKRLNNFSYIISHNLRSHFSNIRSLLNLIDKNSLTDENKLVLEKMTIVSNQLDQTMLDLNEIINIQLKPNINYETINVEKCINRILELYNAEIYNKKIDLEISVPKNYEIKTIPAYFESILFNFISNAIKYSKQNTINKIQIIIKSLGNKTYIEISDEGIGIDLEKYGNELYGLYKKFTNNTDSKGLGLFLAKNQIEALNGKVSVDSKLNEGTTFKIIL